MKTHQEWVTSDYFRTVGLTITQGRGFGPEDSANSRRVSVINETMARRYFPGQNPIGKRLTGAAATSTLTDSRSSASSRMPATTT